MRALRALPRVLPRALGSLDRAGRRVPATAAAGVRFVTKSAIANARRSINDLTTAGDDRRDLVSGLETASVPGDVARLSTAECHELLATKSVGRLAYIARPGVPDIVPVNYVVDGNAVLVRSAPGPKLQAAERGEMLAFEVDEIDGATHTGWSVVVSGVGRRLAPEEHDRSPEPGPWANGPRRHLLRIDLRRISGRRLL